MNRIKTNNNIVTHVGNLQKQSNFLRSTRRELISYKFTNAKFGT